MGSEIYENFLRRASAKGDAPLFYGHSPLSWRRAAVEVEELAGRFAVEKGPLVLTGKNSRGTIISFIAARHAGRMVVLIDDLKGERIIHSLGALLGTFRHYDCEGVRLGQVYGDSSPAEVPDGAAFSLLTSGSTGAPKLVLRTEQSLMDEGRRYAGRYGLHENDVILAALPLSHAFMFGLAMGGLARTGCALHLQPVPNPLRIVEALAEGNVTVLPLVPSLARLVCRALEVKRGKLRGTVLRSVIVGAGPMRKELHEALTDRLGVAPVRNYGCSEMGTLLGSLPDKPDFETAAKPFDGVEVHVRPVSGKQGMFFVRTKSPFIGYLTGDGVDTGKVSPDGWYCTGDIAEAETGGYITVHRRIGEAIHRGGRFIHPHDVCRAIERHPDVQEAVITGEDEGDGEPVVTAWVQTRPGSKLDADGIRGYLMGRLEEYKIPARWNISRSIPRTTAGKAVSTPSRGLPVELGGILGMIAAYRGAAALLWAEEVGLFEAPDMHEGDTSAASAASSMKRRGKEMLASVLSSYGVVTRNDDGAASLRSELMTPFQRDLRAFENAFFGLLSGGNGNPLKSATGESRPLDSPGIAPLYKRLMAYPGRKAALHVARGEWLKSGPVLEIGHPTGILAPLLNRSGVECCRTVSVPDLDGEAAQPDTYGAIYLFNTVRRLIGDGGAAGLKALIRLLTPGGYLLVADIFIDTPGAYAPFKPFFQVDWLLQRELHCATSDELARMCGRLGMVHGQTRDIDGLYSLSIFKK